MIFNNIMRSFSKANRKKKIVKLVLLFFSELVTGMSTLKKYLGGKCFLEKFNSRNQSSLNAPSLAVKLHYHSKILKSNLKD